MLGSRKRRLHVANALALACVTATCFLAACSDDGDGSGGTAGADAGGSSGKASAGGGGKAGASTANGGASASSGRAGEENVAGDSGAGGEAGAEAGGSAGTGGSTAGTGGSAGGATSGSAGSAGAPPVLVPNCVRDTTSGKTIAISADGNDALFGLTHAADGSLYAAGYVQTGVVATEDRSTVVVKIKADGTLDTTWAVQGIAKVNVRATAAGLGGGEMPRGIAFQGTQIIVAGTVETYTTAQTETVLNNDRDVYVLRLNADGTLDTTFGDVATPGIHILPLSAGTVTSNPTTSVKSLSAADAQWGLNVLADSSIIVTSATRSPLPELVAGTPRSDTDFAVVKLTPNGAQDTTFGLADGVPGVYTLDIANASASVRGASVLPDGKLIVTGYSTFNGTQRPVIFKLLANGSALDQSFGLFGVFSDAVGAAGEAYGALLQSDNKLVTVGYGRATAASTSSDFLSIRLTSGGLLDNTYNNCAVGMVCATTATPGRTWFDVGGLNDNGRAMLLSDDRPVLLGSGALSSGQVDGVVVLLSTDGKPGSTGFGAPYGCTAYDFGSVGDSLAAGDVLSDGQIAVVGATSHGNGSPTDSDATFVLIPKP